MSIERWGFRQHSGCGRKRAKKYQWWFGAAAQGLEWWNCQAENLLDLAGRNLGQSLSARQNPNSGVSPPEEVVSDRPPRSDLSPWPARLRFAGGRPRSLVQDGAVERRRQGDKACSAVQGGVDGRGLEVS